MSNNQPPQRRDVDDSFAIEQLPFVLKQPSLMWAIPHKLEAAEAIPTGNQWGEDFARFLAANPAYAGSGLLYSIARDMQSDSSDVSQCCAIAFFARIERVLRQGAVKSKRS